MRRKLLLADDSITVQRVIELTFADEDLDVLTVGDGGQAVALIERERPEIVLADLTMPVRDGYGVAEHVKRTPALVAQTRVVLLGQDPYHGAGQAEGLAFSVPEGVTPPPSLRNVFKEIQRDLGLKPPRHGHLVAWAQRGVLLLNTTLTVEEGKPAPQSLSCR